MMIYATITRFCAVINPAYISPAACKAEGIVAGDNGFWYHNTIFIHYGDLYSAPSRLLLRSAPDTCTAKKKSFETRVECVRKNPGEQYDCT